MSENPHILVATLGGQSQVVTFTLDHLLQAGYPISEVIVLHPRAATESRLQSALHRLHAEITGDYYQAAQRTIHFHSQILELNGQPIDDIMSVIEPLIGTRDLNCNNRIVNRSICVR